MTDTSTTDLSAISWNPRYQDRDWEVVDYQEYRLPGVEMGMRGPAVDPSSANYFSAIGAAQTHGTVVQRPFPSQVAEHVRLDVLNFGYPAANPGYFARQPKIIDYINGGRFLILQVMAARAEPNRFYSEEGYCETLRDRKTGEILPALLAWNKVYETDPQQAAAAVQDSRNAWTEDCRRLIDQIKVPIILLWISHERHYSDRIDFIEDFASSENFLSLRLIFPQFVDRDCVEPVAVLCDEFVVCDSRRNHGPPLISRFTGKPVALDNTLIDPRYKGVTPPMTHNTYYPSQEMHDDAAALLISAVESLAPRRPELLVQK